MSYQIIGLDLFALRMWVAIKLWYWKKITLGESGFSKGLLL